MFALKSISYNNTVGTFYRQVNSLANKGHCVYIRKRGTIVFITCFNHSFSCCVRMSVYFPPLNIPLLLRSRSLCLYFLSLLPLSLSLIPVSHTLSLLLPLFHLFAIIHSAPLSLIPLDLLNLKYFIFVIANVVCLLIAKKHAINF